MVIDQVIEVIDQNGIEGIFDNLATFESRLFKKNYIIFSNRNEEDNKIQIFSGTYEIRKDDNKYIVNTDLSEDERKMINEFIEHMLDIDAE